MTIAVDRQSLINHIKSEVKENRFNVDSLIILLENDAFSLMTNQTITITKAEYDSLQEDSLWLGDLEAAGIDNTMAYEEACSIRRERLGEDDD